MCVLVFLLGSVVLAAATENGTSNQAIFISRSKMLVLVIDPSIDLDLSGLDLRLLNPLAFQYCASVRTLDLSNNWISQLFPGDFSSMTNLEHLSLAHNELKSKVMPGAFHNLASLTSLDITHNPLTSILKNEMFVGLPNSCEIYLGGSKSFHTITPLAFGKTKRHDPKSHEPTTESKNCPDRLTNFYETFDHGDAMFDEQIYSDDVVKMCTDNATLRFIDFSNVTDTQSPNCHKILISDDGTILKIEGVTIRSFDNGWFRIRNTSVNAIYLYPTGFENLTSDLLNDLPANIKTFALMGCDLKWLIKGVMINEHLRDLDLRSNSIEFIESDAFAGLKLTRLNLDHNPLVTLDYVSTLPETLLWLNLEFTGIREIPGSSFSRLKNLLFLNLGFNEIRGLEPLAFAGLVSLRWLNLRFGKVKYIRPGVFRDLSQLYSLNLTENNIGRLDKGAFDGLGCLAKLEIRSNRLESLVGGVFDGLTDSLEVLDLSGNNLEVLEAGTFVDAPKFNLSLRENNIRKIGKDTFDLPYLTNLDLRYNDLTTIEKGAAKRLGNLAKKTEIKLGFNPIQRLDNGALAGLSTTARVNLGMTPIKVIQSGVFVDV